MNNLLNQLKEYTKVVADTGDFESMKTYKPVDATTNPSLIYAASQIEQYSHLVDDAISYAKQQSSEKSKQLSITLDKLAVNFGLEILKIVREEFQLKLMLDYLLTPKLQLKKQES